VETAIEILQTCTTSIPNNAPAFELRIDGSLASTAQIKINPVYVGYHADLKSLTCLSFRHENLIEGLSPMA
jgi:hypothetical protein